MDPAADIELQAYEIEYERRRLAEHQRDRLLAALKDILDADETWEHEAQAKARALIGEIEGK